MLGLMCYDFGSRKSHEDLHATLRPMLVTRAIVLLVIVIVEAVFLSQAVNQFQSMQQDLDPAQEGLVETLIRFQIALLVVAVLAMLSCFALLCALSPCTILSFAFSVLAKSLLQWGFFGYVLGVFGWQNQLQASLILSIVIGTLYLGFAFAGFRLFFAYRELRNTPTYDEREKNARAGAIPEPQYATTV